MPRKPGSGVWAKIKAWAGGKVGAKKMVGIVLVVPLLLMRVYEVSPANFSLPLERKLQQMRNFAISLAR